ncbi:MFS transporter [Spartobacteria bacterium LR76]|nr:MFS transporter [Spartobacteria bacterium LR76]
MSTLSPAPVVKASPEAVPPRKTWRVGTLVYTSGGLVALFSFLIFGDFALSMRDRSVSPIVHWYLNHLQVPNYLYAILLSSFPAALALILCPIISFKSDRLRSRWGRRIPFLIITTPLAAAGMIGLGLTPHIAQWVHSHFPDQSELLVTLVCFGVFWALFEFAAIAGSAVFGGLINDVVPREMVGRFFGLFRAISLIDGMIFNYWLMGKVPDHFTLIMVIVGVYYGVAFTWVCLKVKEGEYPPPAPIVVPEPGAADGRRFLANLRGSFATYFRECFTNSYYISIFVMMMVAGLSFGPVNTFAIPYAASLGISMDTYGKFLALTFCISLVLAYPLGWLADLLHPLRLAIGVLVLYVLVTGWGMFFAKSAGAFLFAWVAHGVISGCYFTSAASLGQRLYPHSRFAQFASAATIVGALVGMAYTPAVGLLIDQTGRAYRYTFVIGCLTATVALVCAGLVYVKFRKLGGPKDYTAPE